jgi:5-hydroxyisourate hydrolase
MGLDMANGFLTTHVLNTGQGKPAAGITITAYRVEGDTRQELAQMTTNDDGRTDQPLLPKGSFPAGSYALVFHVGPYLAEHFPDRNKPFYDDITVAFHSSDDNAHYHIPLLLSPFGYSTYRGS